MVIRCIYLLMIPAGWLVKHNPIERVQGKKALSVGQCFSSSLTLPGWIRKCHAAALTSVAQLVECCPTKQKVAGAIPGQGTRLGCGFSPWSGHILGTTDRCFPLTSMFLSVFFCLPSPLSKNK